MAEKRATMRICLSLLILLGVILSGCGKKSADAPPAGPPQATAPATERPLLARWHFVGGGQFNADTNAAVLRKILALPATGEYREQTLQKLSHTPFQIICDRVMATTNDFAALIRPLLDDLLTAESAGEVRGNSNETPETVFAIRLSPDRAALWSTNLATALQAWTTLPVTPKGAAAWELKKHHAPNLVRVARAGDWLVLGLGQNALPLHDAFTQRIRSGARPVAGATDYWLSVSAEWPRVAAWLEGSHASLQPSGRMELKVAGEGDYLRTKGRFVAVQPFSWKAEPWLIPTNLIREPLISFTAGRGIAPLLGRCRLFGGLPVAPPNQFYAWALGRIPFQTYAAWPARDASNTLARLGPHLVDRGRSNLPPLFGALQFSATNAVLSWAGLPFITPSLEAVTNAPGDFLFASLFPNPGLESPPPMELLAVVRGRTNLVYYDWEITQERLLQWRNLNQLLRAISSEEPAATNMLSQHWLGDIGSKLGNTVTEITLVASNELSLNRKSHGGFTGFEFVALTEWLDAPHFPRSHFHWAPSPLQAATPGLAPSP